MFTRSLEHAEAVAMLFNSQSLQVEKRPMTFVGVDKDAAAKKLEKELVRHGTGFKFLAFESWESKTVKHAMEESLFISLAKRLEKPDPRLITRTIKADILKVYAVHRFEDIFKDFEITTKMGITPREREKAVAAALSHEWVCRRFEKVGEISDLYGISMEDFVAYSTIVD